MAGRAQGTRGRGRVALAALGLGALVLLAGSGLPGVPRLLWTHLLGAELPLASAAEVSLADLSAIPGVTPAYRDAVNLFLQAQRSDNPQRDYRSCIAAFEQLAETTTHPELRLRSHYFLAFTLFLQRDVGRAYVHARRVLALAGELYRDDPRAVLAGRLAEQAERGDASLADLRIAMAAQNGPECSRLAGELARYAQSGNVGTR